MKALDDVELVDRYSQSEEIGASIKVIALRGYRPAWLAVGRPCGRPMCAPRCTRDEYQWGVINAILNLPLSSSATGRPQGSSRIVFRHRYRFSRWPGIAFHNGPILSGWQKRMTSNCRSVDELTGGRFAVTIVRGVVGRKRCGRHQLVVARRRCLRSVRPLARGRSAFHVLLKRHRSERGGRARGVTARTTAMAGVA